MSIIETAMKDFYDNDVDTMIEAIKMNITVSFSEFIYIYIFSKLFLKKHFWILPEQ